MLINIDELSVGDSKKVEEQTVIEIPKRYSRFNRAPVKVKGTLFKDEPGSFRFEGLANAELRLNCDSCLTEFSKTIEFPVFGVFKKETDSSDDSFIFSGNSLELDELLYSELLCSFPMRNVCKEDCKGLCIKCGHNLNEGDCGCDRTPRNPEFEKLLSMFN